MALCTVFLLWISSVMLHEVFSLPMTDQSAGNEPGPAHRRRIKRCSCNNQLDFECHYFCHLDIIWVNTPSKTTVYGLGSPLARRRRSTGRCLCANPTDQTCKGFCMHSSQNAAAPHKNPSEPVQKVHLKSNLISSQNNPDPKLVVVKANVGAAHVDFPTFIRNLVRAKNSAMDMGDLYRNKGFRVYKPDAR